ncbi:hypothetical protein Daura_14385 [Dactylosporangium aurantiacum]|uniref:Uncharacterized protein n=1 Tax=Dactylosporangium aurantiacum TaxID=35754 RepID=A0A9Q9IP07_9ACTN|nr:hypothetical protein [Dactylosporangium aurantiacum]MDG6108581.1 hypothetical protein [Dactylosporangium aurantiacum]UWZ57247.1 hypothetical protein Daura_14385 [Dactylosporangium aurantiacum]
MSEIDHLRRALDDIAGEVAPVDLRDRALTESRRIRNRRVGATALAGVAVLAVALGTTAVRGDDRAPTPEASPPPAVASPTTLPSEVAYRGPDLGPFASGTITVPSWGATLDATCTKGKVTLESGQGVSGTRRPVNVLGYATTDVDHDDIGDYVAYLRCGEGPESGGGQIVAYRRLPSDPSELQPIGQVIGPQDGFAMMDHLQARDGGRIAVLVSEQYSDAGQNAVPNQWRTYALQDGRFRQVDGPTTFPADAPSSRLTVTASALTFHLQGRAFTGSTTVTVRNDGNVPVARLELLLILPEGVRPAGDGWQSCAVRPDPGHNAVVCELDGPGAGATVAYPLTFFAARRPAPVDDPVNLGNHYVAIRQLTPYDGQVVIEHPEAVIPVTVP